MISTHCGKHLRSFQQTELFFIKRCDVCGKTFTQRKRQPDAKLELTDEDKKIILQVLADSSHPKLYAKLYTVWHDVTPIGLITNG